MTEDPQNEDAQTGDTKTENGQAATAQPQQGTASKTQQSPDAERSLKRRVSAFFATERGKQTLLAAVLIIATILFATYCQNFACGKARHWLNLYNAPEMQQPDGFFACLLDTDDTVREQTQSVGNNPPSADDPPPSNVNTGAGTSVNANAGTNAPGQSNQNAASAGNANAVGAGGANQPGKGPVATPTPKATPTPAPTPTPCLPLSGEQGRVLDEQARIIKSLARHHGEVLEFFFANYYMAITVVMLTGVIAAAALLSVTRKGWVDANSYAKTVFVVMTAATAYYGLFPSVFEQEKNISENKELFLEYKTLENEVMSYRATCGNLKGEAGDPKVFITYVNAEIDRLSNIAVGFDYTKINYKGIFDINRPANANTPAATSADTSNTTNTRAGGRHRKSAK